MATAATDKSALVEKIDAVFRQYGYEGASISRLVEASGLQRSSLYHHFPGGKDEMAKMVLGQALQRFVNAVLKPLSDNGSIKERLENMACGLREIYCDGKRSCLLNTFSLDLEAGELKKTVEAGFNAWLEATTSIAIEAGFKKDEARSVAEDVLIKIQGALVFARVTGNKAPFIRITEKLPDLLIKK